MTEIIIVDRKDNIIGYKKKGTLEANDFYRVSALWVTNSKGEILLAQRSRNKKNHPGKRGPAVSGTIEKGETYFDNIVKETEEEIGIKSNDFKDEFKYFSDGKYKHFTKFYSLVLDLNISEFTIQEDEVESIKWFTKEELEFELKNNSNKYLESLKKIYFECFSLK